MRKILVIAPDSIHTKKFIDMISDDHEVLLIVIGSSDLKYDVPIRRIKNNLFQITSIYRAIKEFHPDIIHIHTINLICLLISILNNFIFKAPLVITSWGSDVLVAPFISMFHRMAVKYCLEAADFITYDSFIQKFVIRKISHKTKKLIEANFGIPNNILQSSTSAKQNIIYSSRSHSINYNIENIITKFAIFHDINRDFKLIISGIPDQIITPRLHKLIDELNLNKYIDIIGLVDSQRNAELMRDAKIYVSIPTSDAKSISVMEAVYANCIVFASDVPANYEMVLNGVNGFLSAPEDLDFTKYIDIKLENLTQVNSQLVSSFSPEINSLIFKNIYSELLKSNIK